MEVKAPILSTYEQRLQINQVNDVKEEIIGRETINGANRLPAIQTNPNTIRKMNSPWPE